MEKSAILHFNNEEYLYKLNSDTYLFRLVSKKDDLKSVKFVYLDKYSYQHTHCQKKLKMTLVAKTTLHDYYEATIKIKAPSLKYYFILEGDEVSYFGNGLFFDSEPSDLRQMFTVNTYNLDNSYLAVPDWSKGAIYYQIFPERFAPTADYSPNWFKDNIDFRFRTNGTLWGITKKLDYLSDLGIDVIYLNPIFLAHTSHRYDTVDYMQVCPLLGGDEALLELVTEAHKRGIKVILDVAFNHTSTDFFAFKDLLLNQENSPYKDWYFIKKFPFKIGPNEYKSFGYFYFMPKLNTNNPEVISYLLKVTRHYLEKFGIDGFRLDVCDEVSHNFWQEFRTCVKKINPEALILGEIWYESSPWLRGNEIDTITNYISLNAIRDVCNEQIALSEFIDIYETQRGRGNLNYLPATLNMISNHDTERALRAFKGDKDKLKLAMALNLTLPGGALIYYGDEMAMDGARDPDCRRGMRFDGDKEMYSYTKRLIAIHKLFKDKINVKFQADGQILSYTRDDYEIYLNFGKTPYPIMKRFDLITNCFIETLLGEKAYVFKKKR